MKRLIILVIAIVLTDILFQQCANPINPTGGPKDTIPPTLLNGIPVTGTTNFKNQTITLEFDEFINADKLKQNLVITPKSNFKYKHQVKRMQLILKFEEAFADSTTYSLNFFDGVTDITEKNPVVNLYLAFSTGSFIDSMKVSGDVSDLFTEEKLKGFMVGLYPITDTLDFLTNSPTYFTTTDDRGIFELNFIKSGKYKIISFEDDNRNLLLDPETEAHGFLSDTINLTKPDLSFYLLRTQLMNIKPIQFINARPVGQYIEAKYSREISNYSITPDTIASIVFGEKKDAIRLYNKNDQYAFGDSIQLIINTYDSLGNNSIDTIKTVFRESSRKLPSFSSTITTKQNQIIKSNQTINVSFNKPIIRFDTTKFYFQKDSTFIFQLQPTLTWNENRTKVSINSSLNLDTLLSQLEKSLPVDTTKTKEPIENSTGSKKIIIEPIAINTSLNFQIEEGAFISIENDTTKTQKLLFKTYIKQSFGTLNINLTTEKSSFTLQLLSKGKVSYQSKNQKNVSFPKVKPGVYTIRILIDDNNDGIWSPGNILKNEEPERIFLHPEETSIRENWVIDLEVSFE